MKECDKCQMGVRDPGASVTEEVGSALLGGGEWVFSRDVSQKNRLELVWCW